MTNHIIEQAIFDRLNYSLPAMFNIEANVNVTIYGLTLVTAESKPFFNFTNNCFLRIFDMRFEITPPIPDTYPAEKLLLWIFVSSCPRAPLD